jgi:hypothetical protein
MLVSLQPLQRNTTGTFTNKAVYQFGKELHEQACSASSYRKATGHAPLITTSVGAASAAKPFKNSKGIAARQYIAMRQRMRCTYQAWPSATRISLRALASCLFSSDILVARPYFFATAQKSRLKTPISSIAPNPALLN